MRVGAAYLVLGWKPGKDIEGSRVVKHYDLPEEITQRCYYVGREGLMPWDGNATYLYYRDPILGAIFAQKREFQDG